MLVSRLRKRTLHSEGDHDDHDDNDDDDDDNDQETCRRERRRRTLDLLGLSSGPGVGNLVLTEAVRIGGEVRTVSQMPTESEICRGFYEAISKFPLDHRFQLIYVNPPWKVRGRIVSRRRKLVGQPLFTVDELARIPVQQIACAQSICLIWTEGENMHHAVALLEHWGFQYNTIFLVLSKRYRNGQRVMGAGMYTRPSTEMLICGQRDVTDEEESAARDTDTRDRLEIDYLIVGRMPTTPVRVMRQDVTVPQEMFEDIYFATSPARRGEKPARVRRLIEKFFRVTRGNRIELFAQEIDSNWSAWGLEVPGYFYDCERGKPLGSGAGAGAGGAADPVAGGGDGAATDDALGAGKGRVHRRHQTERGEKEAGPGPSPTEGRGGAIQGENHRHRPRQDPEFKR